MPSRILMLPLALALASCGQSDSASSDLSDVQGIGNPDYADSGKQVAWNELGKETIKGKLKDPDSAQFRNVEFYSGSGQPITCGEVNSKNGFGGYGGYERFIAAGSTLTVLESEVVAGGMDEVWATYCR